MPRKAIKLNNRQHFLVEVRLLSVTFSHKQFGVVTLGLSKGRTFSPFLPITINVLV